jgi:amino acid permease
MGKMTLLWVLKTNNLQDLTQIQLTIIVFCTQIVFLWLRTLNVVYISKLLILPSILTGIGIGISWLIAVAIGVNALMDFQPLPIIGHLLGGVLGTYIGLVREKKKRVKKLLEEERLKTLERKELPQYIF